MEGVSGMPFKPVVILVCSTTTLAVTDVPCVIFPQLHQELTTENTNEVSLGLCLTRHVRVEAVITVSLVHGMSYT